MDTKIQTNNALLNLTHLTPPGQTMGAETLPNLEPASRFPRLAPSDKGKIGDDLDFLRQLAPSVQVTVKKGDTLEALLMKEGYSRHEIYDKGILKQVCQDNNLEDPNQVAVGQTLRLPTKNWKLPAKPFEFPGKRPWWEKGNEM